MNKEFWLVRALRYVGIVGLALLGMALTPAFADADFNFDLSFTDGGTAIGHLTVDASDNFTFFDVVTSGASGFEYDTGNGSPSPFFSDGNLYLSFTRPGTGGYLVLEFSEPVDGNGFYDLKFAGSFECVGGTEQFALGRPTPICSGGTRRQIVTPADLVVPEPASLALLGTGLVIFGWAAMRRRARKR